ncbi:MAG: META domain-containing protein [Vicinamibacteria bacterium]
MTHRNTRRAALLAVLLSAACADGPTAPSDVLETEWRLASVQLPGASPVANGRPDRFTLRLGADGNAGARVSCNVCGGGYQLSGDRLTVSSLACTLAFCAPIEGVPTAIDAYPTLLEGATAVSGDGATLTLTSERGTLRFVR